MADEVEFELIEVELDRIDVGPRLRKEVHASTLTQSIQAVGLIHPIVVRPNAAGRYDLVAGHRRVEAYRLLGRDTISASLAEVDDGTLVRIELDENVERVQLARAEQAQENVERIKRSWQVKGPPAIGIDDAAQMQGEAEEESSSIDEGSERVIDREYSQDSENDEICPAAGQISKSPQKQASDRRKKVANIRALAEAASMSKTSVQRDMRYVEAVEKYPFLRNATKDVGVTLASKLDAVDERVRPTLVALIDENIPPPEVVAVVSKLVSEPPKERERIARLYNSENAQEHSLAITIAAARPAMPSICGTNIAAAMTDFRSALSQLALAITHAPDELKERVKAQVALTRKVILAEVVAWDEIAAAAKAWKEAPRVEDGHAAQP